MLSYASGFSNFTVFLLKVNLLSYIEIEVVKVWLDLTCSVACSFQVVYFSCNLCLMTGCMPALVSLHTVSVGSISYNIMLKSVLLQSTALCDLLVNVL